MKNLICQRFTRILKNKKKKGIYHQLLSGKVEDSETYIDAIIREIQEETSLNICKTRIKYLVNNSERTLFFLELFDEEINNIVLSNEHIGYTFIKKK